ncbi:MAG: (2Fe-2S)-binding protein [Bacteroidales bacterium]|nr:(2Fe-2S)-binding protein [Bacteroidales bacterium]
MVDDILICTCNEIYKSEIVKAILEKRLTTVEEVGEATTAGTVCGQCQDDIQDILNELNK